MALTIIPPCWDCGEPKREGKRRRRRKPGVIDDGYHPELVEGAEFDGVAKIPLVPAPKRIVEPTLLVPWSKAARVSKPGAFGCFYEDDLLFREIFTDLERKREILNTKEGWVSPDPSLCRNMPPVLQAANVYMNRAVAFRLSKLGYNVIVNVRWGDETTYTDTFFSEPVAFLGAPKNSIVSIGTYGCTKTRRDKHYLRDGLEAMLAYLTPQVVLVYGAMSHYVFDGLRSKTEFVSYPDWTTFVRGGRANGKR